MSYRITAFCLLAFILVVVLVWGTNQGWVMESWNPLDEGAEPVDAQMREDRERALGQVSSPPAAIPLPD